MKLESNVLIIISNILLTILTGVYIILTYYYNNNYRKISQRNIAINVLLNFVIPMIIFIKKNKNFNKEEFRKFLLTWNKNTNISINLYILRNIFKIKIFEKIFKKEIDYKSFLNNIQKIIKKMIIDYTIAPEEELCPFVIKNIKKYVNLFEEEKVCEIIFN